jgi:hypothetical protein
LEDGGRSKFENVKVDRDKGWKTAKNAYGKACVLQIGELVTTSVNANDMFKTLNKVDANNILNGWSGAKSFVLCYVGFISRPKVQVRHGQS